LAATIKARWICEQAHQQLKKELGLDHFEGRSWQGLHQHALMTMIADASFSIARSKQRDGKEESMAHRLSQLCQPCGKPFSNSSPSHQSSVARIAKNEFATSSGVSKSAKVVLVSTLQREQFVRRHLSCAPRDPRGLCRYAGRERPLRSTMSPTKNVFPIPSGAAKLPSGSPAEAQGGLGQALCGPAAV
jgi:hypothetical protein